MKRVFKGLVIIGLLCACTISAPVASTSTPKPVVPPGGNPTVENLPVPTNTAVPVEPPTEAPTNTPEPTEAPAVTVADLEEALRDEGYVRYNYDVNLRDGKQGFMWVSDNVFEVVVVYADGYARFEVLNDKKNDTRNKHMEDKLRVMDRVFSSGFMSQLRAQSDAYLSTVGTSVTGDAAQLWKFKDWNMVIGQYNVSNTTIEGYPVAFALWFQQYTCPVGYKCWYPLFRAPAFTGDSSFVFYDIEITVKP